MAQHRGRSPDGVEANLLKYLVVVSDNLYAESGRSKIRARELYDAPTTE